MNEEMRKEFEEWIISNNNNIDVPNFIMKNDNRAYVDPHTALLWIGWQASREAMKPITLPVSKEIYHMAQHGMTNMIDLEDTISAIESAGYKVAP